MDGQPSRTKPISQIPGDVNGSAYLYLGPGVWFMKALVTGNLPNEIIAMLTPEHEIVVNTNDRPMPREDILAKHSGQGWPAMHGH